MRTPRLRSYATRPVFVVPDHKLTRQDIAAVCRYHYEGTSIDQTADYSLIEPARSDQPPDLLLDDVPQRGVAAASWKPDDIGGVMWVALSRPCSSHLRAFYDSVTSVPAAWSGRTAFNEFRDVAESLDRNGTINGLTRYGYYIPLVKSIYGAFETDCTNAQASTETTAAGLNGAARIDLPDQLLRPARDAGAEPGGGAAGADAVSA